MWPSSSARQMNYGLTTDMNMVGVGLRDLLVVAPPQHHHQDSTTITFGPLHSYSNNYATASTQGGGVGGVGVGVNLIPLLSSAPCLPSHPHTRMVDADSDAAGDAQNCAALPSLLKCGPIGGDGGSTAACLDCGNQSKKDCNHGRCRTCCKGRGYDCTTHVKSTWIPAASRRRDKQCNSSSGSKKPRLITTCSENTSTSNTTTPRSFDNSSSQQDTSFKESLPEQVQAPAKFKFLRFTSIEDGEEEYAYEAMVKIGGHIFKGVLHDKGIAHSKDGIPNIAELHLGGYSGGVEVLSSTKKPIYK